MLNKIDQELLKLTSDLHSIPQGAYSIRKNGKSIGRASTASIQIDPMADGDGLTITVKPNTKNESIHIPVILASAGMVDVVKNDFYIGDNCELTIVAGCGIHADKNEKVEHDGIHKFVIGKNSKVKYVERHIGKGKGINKVLNPVTQITLGEGSTFEMETAQLSGVGASERKTIAVVGRNATLKINEKILTEGDATATTDFVADLIGENASAHIVSRAVAKDASVQHFNSVLNGKQKCFGHTECDAIIVGDAKVFAKPEVNALHPDSSLVHEAAIGKIAGEQIQKLLTLGLTEEEAQSQILNGFLK